MKHVPLLLVLLAAPLLMGFGPVPAEPDGATTFVVHFERTARPDFTVSTSEFSGNAELYANSMFGGSLKLEHGTWVKYSVDGRTFPVETGTLEFWLMPLWEPDSTDSAGVLSVSAGRTDYLKLNLLPGGRFGVAMRGSSKGEPRWGRVDAGRRVLDMGRWTHVAITWSTESLALFIGGREAGRTGEAAPMVKSPDEIHIGGGEFLIGELRISSVVRYPEPDRPIPAEPPPTAKGWSLHEPEGVYEAGFDIPEAGPPVRLAVKNYDEDIDPHEEPDWSSAGTGIVVRAARGETEPATFVLVAAENLSDVEVKVRGIESEVRRVVRAPMRRIYTAPPEDHEIVGRFLPLWKKQDVPDGEFREVWLTIRVPENAQPGRHEGLVEVTAGGGVRATMPLSLTVLPFELPPDPAKRMGMYYRMNGRLLDRKRVRDELRDMTRHGVTDLVLDVGPDYVRVGEEVRPQLEVFRGALAEVRRAMIHGTVVVQSGLDRLVRLYPGLEDSPEFRKQVSVGAAALRLFAQECPRANLAATHMDEVFKEGRLDRYVALAKIARQYGYPPLYITFHTADDAADELRKRLDPHVDIRGHHGYTFEWWLARGHSFYEYRKELEESDDEAWLYHNVRGSYFPALWGRLINGLYLKASPFTVSCPWIYQSYGRNPFDDTDSPEHDFGFAFPLGDDLVPTRIYECLREGQDDCRYLMLLEKTALELREKRPKAAMAALRFLRDVETKVTDIRPMIGKRGTRGEAPVIDALSKAFDGAALDAIRREAADRILDLRHTGSLCFWVRLAHGPSAPRILVTMMGDDGAPVLDLYDKGFDPDAEGGVVLSDLPSGRYSLRLHRQLEFQVSEGYDNVAVVRVEIPPGGTAPSVRTRLAPGGRMRVSLTDETGAGIPARLVVRDPERRKVATTFWRGKEGGWTTQHLALSPAVTSCVLPEGIYTVEATQYRKVIASSEVTIEAGHTTDLNLTLPQK